MRLRPFLLLAKSGPRRALAITTAQARMTTPAEADHAHKDALGGAELELGPGVLPLRAQGTAEVVDAGAAWELLALLQEPDAGAVERAVAGRAASLELQTHGRSDNRRSNGLPRQRSPMAEL